ncbi:IclR family transcriptional regulator [Streptomyces armeniacus]|uniref:IclR family transcriptional regulator n=1 Tax=Streptomyces armeniacus TaxID=83291 RepID=A0A345XXI0_9ACTN|nr:IclR family transcriptional regulator [Streptomyces armeniacus]AXK36346.1 IclR family transcriptional regulator [Streptomyces armeniacus]
MGNETQNAGTAGGRGGGSLVQSVDRAVTVLAILARHGEAGVTEIAEELGVHKSTAFRLVGALEQRDLVEQTADRGKYQLAYGIVRLAGAASAQLEITRESRAVCQQLAEESGEGVNIAVLDRGEAINVSQIRALRSVSAYNWVGQRTPLHATSSGKVLLAFESPERGRELISGGLERFTDHTVCDVRELQAELERVRERGWSSTTEELEVGLNAIACPVYGAEGEVVAALSISGPSYRLSTDVFPQLARVVGEAAAEVSARIERRA